MNFTPFLIPVKGKKDFTFSRICQILNALPLGMAYAILIEK
jgi:hypothetical protein